MKYIAYYRVSTQEQGRSGLGLAAQQTQVKAFVNDNDLLAEYTDIESGKRNKRPELLKAIEHCKQSDSILVIAKLDRLSRNSVFIGQLLESKVKFRCCDIPEADSFTIHIFAAMAQREGEMISKRVTEALAAAKKRGTKLGNPNLPKGSQAAKDCLKKAREARIYDNIHPDKIEALKALKQNGVSARCLSDKSVAILGKKYSRVHLWRLLKA